MVLRELDVDSMIILEGRPKLGRSRLALLFGFLTLDPSQTNVQGKSKNAEEDENRDENHGQDHGNLELFPNVRVCMSDRNVWFFFSRWGNLWKREKKVT
jgi:hypothetical protein